MRASKALLLLLFGICSPTMAEPSLETLVWTMNESQLLSLEKQIVRRIQVEPLDPKPFYLLAHIRVREFAANPEDLALVKQASDLAQQAIELEPRSDYGYIALASTLDVMGQPGKAVHLLETAASSGVEPTWRYYFSMARLKAQQASKEHVLALLEQSLAFRKSQPAVIVPYIVAVLQTTSQGGELLSNLHEWDRKFSHPLFKQTLAQTLTEAGRYEQAHQIYKNLIVSNPSVYESQINNAILLYKHLGKPSLALRQLIAIKNKKKLASINPYLYDVSLNLHLGAAYLANKQDKKATAHFLQAVKRSPNHIKSIDFITKAYRSVKKGKLLPKFIQRLTQEISPSGILYAVLGESQSEDLADHEAALQSFSDAILLDPNRSDFYNGLGLTYYRMDRHDEALNYFNEATRIDPNDATAMYNGACVLSRLGRVKESLTTLQEALNLDPRLADHARSDQDFNNIKSHPEFQLLIDSRSNENMLSH